MLAIDIIGFGVALAFGAVVSVIYTVGMVPMFVKGNTNPWKWQFAYLVIGCLIGGFWWWIMSVCPIILVLR